MNQKIKTRFAPSPTGFLHVGGLRTALYNFLFAKKNQGDFLLRIEDTDQSRVVAGAEENLKKTLKLFNLDWDNKKIIIQSARKKIYQKAAEDLVKNDKAYLCFCPKSRLEKIKALQKERRVPPRYDGNCRMLTSDDIAVRIKANKPSVIRFKVPGTGNTEFTDLIRGRVSFDNKILDDQIILKSDGLPTYHLASVIDDHEMEITHVIRGEEWLSSTPKHLLLYLAFGWTPPAFSHLPLLLNADRSKLSKRQGDVAVEDYLKKGYLPEAILNFILLLGWNPGTEQEIFNLEEMIETFDLAKVNKAGAIFNSEKLDWLNGCYLRKKTDEELAKLALPYFKKAGLKPDLSYLEKVVATEKERIKKLEEIVLATEFFFKEPIYDPKLLLWQKMTKDQTLKNLKEILSFLEKMPEKKWQKEILEKETINFINQNQFRIGEMLWPMRVALTGKKNSPGNFEIAEALGKKNSMKRIKKAIVSLEKL